MTRYEEALAVILAEARPGTGESVPIESACGRVAAETLAAGEPLPPFDNSAMDGFAVRASETLGPLVRLRVLGAVAAGDAPPAHCAEIGCAWEIMTGAPVPQGFDAVIKVEETMRDGERVIPAREVRAGEHLRCAGEDFAPGSPVLRRGTRIFPEHLMALAALGIQSVPVCERPRVAVLSTGDELVEGGEALAPGRIRNSTGIYLEAELRSLGADPWRRVTVPDDPSRFVSAVRAALDDGAHTLISTGAVSMGRHDFVTEALGELGAEVLFHRVAIRPGKPLLFARLPRRSGPPAAFFGIPGNPVSTAVGLRFFVEPYLRACMGTEREVGWILPLERDAVKPEGLRCFFKSVLVSGEAGMLAVRVLPGQESFRVAPLLCADSWAVLPEEGARVAAGTRVRVFPIHAAAKEAATNV